MTGSATVVRGDALNLDIPDASVDLIVTSPPYFGLRSYQDNGEHYSGQIGSEPTPAEFVDALIAATREMMRVLKPSGSIWVNLGDKYAATPGQYGKNHANGLNGRVPKDDPTPDFGGVKAKSLIGVPWRYALRCIDELGLILRAEVIWSKPNGLPESVTDRVRRSHETWFHFTVRPRYYSAVDEVREEYTAPNATRTNGDSMNGGLNSGGANGRRDAAATANPLGKLPGSVWTIPTQPLKVPAHLGVDHFAAFPMEWPRRIIRGWSPAEVCSACGEGRRPVVDRERIRIRESTTATRGAGAANVFQNNGEYLSAGRTDVTITGYACACPDTSAPSTPGVVLDPFSGTGTTILLAKVLGRHGIGVDLSADYCRLAEWRTNDPGELARAMQVEKPDAVHIDQLDLFGESA